MCFKKLIAINCDNKTLSLIPFVTNAILNWNSSTLEVQTIIKLNSDQFDTNDKYFQSNLIKSKMELLPFMMIDLTEKTTESNAPEFHVRRLARELLLPTIALGRQISRLDRFPAEWQQLTAVEQQFLIQLHPPIDLMSQVVPHLLHHFRPKAVTLLYEKAFHLEARVGHLFKKFKGRHVLRQIDGKQPNHLRKVMEDMIKIRNGHFYVLASIDTLNQILRLVHLN